MNRRFEVEEPERRLSATSGASCRRLLRACILAAGVMGAARTSDPASLRAIHCLADDGLGIALADLAAGDLARGAEDRCRLLDYARGEGEGEGEGGAYPVHHRARHAARLSGADGEGRLEYRSGGGQAGVDRFRRGRGSGR